MTKYRIKIITYQTGRKEYYAQYKVLFGWKGIMYNGGLTSYPSEASSRDHALDRIDRHYAGNTKKQSIEFEYINK